MIGCDFINNLILRIRSMYDNMGKGEKKIADRILEDPGELISLSISELAERCDCGEATIVRFARRLGLSGYQELKISIAQETANSSPVVNEAITDSDTCFEIFKKVTQDINASLQHTQKVLNSDSMDEAAALLLKAGRIVIFGLGNSASVAMDAQHKFLRAGLNAAAYSDNHMQAIAASHLTKGDVAIGISHSGSSKDVVEALKLSRASGACTICITNFGKSPILKEADISLFTASEETRKNIMAMNSRIAQLALIDSLYIYIILNRSEESAKAIQNTERALQNKKY